MPRENESYMALDECPKCKWVWGVFIDPKTYLHAAATNGDTRLRGGCLHMWRPTQERLDGLVEEIKHFLARD